MVTTSARFYESVAAAISHREPKVLFHAALVVQTGSIRKIIECAWPSPDDELSERGVVVVGPVFTRFLERFRTFRYEVRCWEDGIIPDLEFATTPLPVGEAADTAERVVAAVDAIPAHRWGRDDLGVGEMWNSNSVISFVLATAGVPVVDLDPPTDGRAPGWTSGIAAAGSREAWDQRLLLTRQ